MKTPEYVLAILLGSLMLTWATTVQAADNLHFYGNLLNKTCTPVETQRWHQ